MLVERNRYLTRWMNHTCPTNKYINLTQLVICDFIPTPMHGLIYQRSEHMKKCGKRQQTCFHCVENCYISREYRKTPLICGWCKTYNLCPYELHSLLSAYSKILIFMFDTFFFYFCNTCVHYISMSTFIIISNEISFIW